MTTPLMQSLTTLSVQYGEQDMLSHSMAFVVKNKIKISNNKLNILKGICYYIMRFSWFSFWALLE